MSHEDDAARGHAEVRGGRIRPSRFFNSPVASATNPTSFAGRLSRSIAAALAIGIAFGAVEVGAIAAGERLTKRPLTGRLQMNRHVFWMMPLSNVLLIGGLGLATSPSSAASNRLSRFARRLLWAAGVYGLGTHIEGVYPVGLAFLAAGLGFQISRFWENRPAAARRAAIGVLLGVGPVMLAGGLAEYERIAGAEDRALSRLAGTADRSAPNVLLIVLDTLRGSAIDLGTTRPEGRTPNLASLARESIVFREARTSASWTLPAHVTLMTGLWTSQRIVDQDRPLPDSARTLAEAAFDRGYATGGFVANTYFCNSWFGLAQGFTRYEDVSSGGVDVNLREVARASGLGRAVLGWGASLGVDPFALIEGGQTHRRGVTAIRKDARRINGDFLAWLDASGGDARRAGRPFLGFLNYMDAHDPYQLPEDMANRLNLSPLDPAAAAIVASWHGLANEPEVDPKQIEVARSAYLDCVRGLDRGLGDLFAELKRRGIWDDTLIVVTSDHGESFGEHGVHLHGSSVYREEAHVPLLIKLARTPGAPSRSLMIDRPVSTRDVAATVVDMLGWDEAFGNAPSERFPGRSLARLWSPSRSPNAEEPEIVLTETGLKNPVFRPNPKHPARRPRAPAARGPLRALVMGRWVLIRNGDGIEELYDHGDDPGETRNLLEFPSVANVERDRALAELRERLDALVASFAANTSD